MADVARPRVGRRAALAQVVHQAGIAHRQRRLQARRLVQHQHQVHAGVHLGVVLGRLRHAPQRSTSGSRRASAPQSRSTASMRLGQPSIRPRDSSCHTRSGTSASTSPAATMRAAQRLVSSAMRKSRPAGREARQAQQAHRVLGEGVGHVAQHAVAQVGHAAEGVDQGVPCSSSRWR
jgi:hypothetical protein